MIKATKGVLIQIKTELYRNIETLEVGVVIKKLAKKHGGIVTELKWSPNERILFIEINKNKQIKEFLREIKREMLI